MAPPPPLTGAAFHDPSNTGPRESPTLRHGGVFSVYSAADIAAPPKYVYDALVDVGQWHEWNRFVPGVRITKHPHPHSLEARRRMAQGACMTFSVRMTAPPDGGGGDGSAKDDDSAPLTSSKEVCSHLEPLKADASNDGAVTRIRWVFDNAGALAPGFVLRAERVNELEAAQRGAATRYRTWETFDGWAAGYVRRRYGAILTARFAMWSRDLKARAEELYARDLAGTGADAGAA